MEISPVHVEEIDISRVFESDLSLTFPRRKAPSSPNRQEYELLIDHSFRNMATNGLIDAQFDRAVEIVQGLPKTGPIQTDYEEKLTMYRYDFL